MLSDHCQTSYHQLLELLQATRVALHKDETVDLDRLMVEHRRLMRVLQASTTEQNGLSQAQLQTLRDEVIRFLTAAEQQRNRIGNLLASLNRRQQQVAAYAKAQSQISDGTAS